MSGLGFEVQGRLGYVSTVSGRIRGFCGVTSADPYIYIYADAAVLLSGVGTKVIRTPGFAQ